MIWFANPQAGYLLLLLVLVALLYWAGRIRSQKARQAFARQELLGELLTAGGRGRGAARPLLTGLALLFCVLALMRPQWAARADGRLGIDILVALDTSRSMLAEDVQPNRLSAAKSVVRNLAARFPGERMGLIAFSGTAFLACPLTTDRAALMLTLSSLDESAIPRGGTCLACAISEGMAGLPGESGPGGILVVLSDGEDLEGDPAAMAVRARDRGVAVFALGMGTPEGGLIPLPEGSGGFVKDGAGNIVKTRLNEGTLKQVAAITGGRYLNVREAEEPAAELAGWLSSRPGRGSPAAGAGPSAEGFQIPLLCALLCLLAEGMVGAGRGPG